MTEPNIEDRRSPAVIECIQWFHDRGHHAATKGEAIRHLFSKGYSDGAYIPAYLLRLGDLEPVEIAGDTFYVLKGFEGAAHRDMPATQPDAAVAALYSVFGMRMPEKIQRSVCYSPVGMRKGRSSAEGDETE